MPSCLPLELVCPCQRESECEAGIDIPGREDRTTQAPHTAAMRPGRARPRRIMIVSLNEAMALKRRVGRP